MKKINGRHFFSVILGLSATLVTSNVLANEDLCAPIQQRVNQAYQERINATKPSISAGEYVQQNYDIKGILNQNVTGGFSKLLSLDFSNIANSIVNSAMSRIGQKTYSAINGTVNNAINTAVKLPAPIVTAPIQPAAPEPATPTGPYSWAKAKINGLFGN